MKKLILRNMNWESFEQKQKSEGGTIDRKEDLKPIGKLWSLFNKLKGSSYLPNIHSNKFLYPRAGLGLDTISIDEKTSKTNINLKMDSKFYLNGNRNIITGDITVDMNGKLLSCNTYLNGEKLPKKLKDYAIEICVETLEAIERIKDGYDNEEYDIVKNNILTEQNNYINNFYVLLKNQGKSEDVYNAKISECELKQQSLSSNLTNLSDFFTANIEIAVRNKQNQNQMSIPYTDSSGNNCQLIKQRSKEGNDVFYLLKENNGYKVQFELELVEGELKVKKMENRKYTDETIDPVRMLTQFMDAKKLIKGK